MDLEDVSPTLNEWRVCGSGGKKLSALHRLYYHLGYAHTGWWRLVLTTSRQK